jgi:site-specific DNA-methyltransferase (adenine-specific)
MVEFNNIYCMDCLEGMKQIPDKSIDNIQCDLPYGQTENGWDLPIPLDELWNEYLRIIKPNGAIVLFGQGMFTAELMMSQKKLWIYNLVWEKGKKTTGFLNAKKMPLRAHEDIIIFYQTLPTYNPQFTRGNPTHKKTLGAANNCYGVLGHAVTKDYLGCQKFPISILKFDKPYPPIHPTEKPVPLLEYLIRTYTNEGDLVLDNCMGSGTTAEACVRTGRQFIGFEKERSYFDLAQNRIKKAQEQGKISTWF